MSEERFIDLEMRLAHQDQLLNELNDVVGMGIDQLKERIDLSFCSDLDDFVKETNSDSYDGINFEGSPSMRKSNKKKQNDAS